MGRAEEATWWRGMSERFFGCKGVMETEVNCVVGGTGVYRILLRKR